MRNSTPFFAAFGSLLFGRAPRSRLHELLGQWPQRPSINQYMETFGELIPQTLLGRSKEKVETLHNELVLGADGTFPTHARLPLIPAADARRGPDSGREC